VTGVSAGGDEDIVGPERSAGSGQLPALLALARIALNACHSGVLENLGPGFHGGAA